MSDEAHVPRAGQDPSGTQPGDKVRIRTGAHAGARGLVRSVHGDDLVVALTAGDARPIRIPAAGVTNYSLAARRAWEVMPKRSGRPPAGKQRKRMASFRLDADVQEMLDLAADAGLVPSKSEAVNTWLRERLESLLGALDPGPPEEGDGTDTP